MRARWSGDAALGLLGLGIGLLTMTYSSLGLAQPESVEADAPSTAPVEVPSPASAAEEQVPAVESVQSDSSATELPNPAPALAQQPPAAVKVSETAPSPPTASENKLEAKPFAFLRLGGYFSGRKLRDSALDNLLGTAGVRTVATPWLSFTLSAVGEASSFDKAQLKVLDAVASLRLADALQLLAGRFVVPFDRFNLSGPYRTLVWTYPGFYGDAKLIGAESGPFGRSTGAALWGSVGGGTLKYYVAAHELDTKPAQPRLSGRLAVTLLDKEPEYFVASTYTGARDVIALGAAAQYQHNGRILNGADGAVSSKFNLWAITGDAFVEKRWTDVGTFTLDAAYYHYDSHRVYDWGYYTTLAYALPFQWADGTSQLAFRWQAAHANKDLLTAQELPIAGDVHGVDLTLAHTIASRGVRLAVDYAQQTLSGNTVATRIYLGMQYSWL